MKAKVKNAFAILLSYALSFTRDGEEVTEDIVSKGPFGDMKVYPGGSAYLGTMDILVPVFGVITLLRGVVFRIRASDGKCVAETRDSYRADPWFNREGEAQRGRLCWELIGDESRISFAKEALKTFPALAKLERVARAELKRRAEKAA